jgi:2-phospho-L-lactate guanylyltransferase
VRDDGRVSTPGAAAGAPGPWVVVVPVKPLDRAKSRLAAVPPQRRAALALAMALDVVEILRAVPAVGRVVVVTSDATVAAAARELGDPGGNGSLGVLHDLPDAGLNPALAYAAAVLRADGTGPLAAVPADLPELRPGDVAAALTAAATVERGMIPDAAGTGTVLLTSRSAPLRPAFGPGSAARHWASGAVDLAGSLPGIPGLRHDIDTAADLAAVLRPGPRTRRWLEG